MNIIRTLLITMAISMMIVPFAFSNEAKKTDTTEMIKIKGGKFKHFFKKEDEEFITVKDFYLDKYAVTNAQFLEFVKENPQWSKSKVSRLFADQSYLKHWEEDFVIHSQDTTLDKSPVTNVSWFAANAYCKWKGKRLPTLAEWEYVAASDIKKEKGNENLTTLQIIFKWYSKPAPDKLPNVGSTFQNAMGVYDMHGLIWEWIYDFNSSLTSSDSRNSNSLEKNDFCGAASSDAINKEDYASFMRYGFRASLKGAYTVHNLGFRCAQDRKKK